MAQRKKSRRYTDKDGYLRGELKHSDLIHRQIAYRKIYLKNREKYPYPFKEYQVHHIDGNKKNNKISNLQIVTIEEHRKIHGLPPLEKTPDKPIEPIKEEEILTREDLEDLEPEPEKKYYIKKQHKSEENRLIHFIFFIAILIILVIIIYFSIKPALDSQPSVLIENKTNNEIITPPTTTTPEPVKPEWEYFIVTKDMNITDCNAFTHNGYSNFGQCMGERAVFFNNPQDCLNIPEQDWNNFEYRNQCLVQLAVLTNNLSLCDLVHDTFPNFYGERSLNYESKCAEFLMKINE